MLTCERLEANKETFYSFTSVLVSEFYLLLDELLPAYEVAYRASLERPNRQHFGQRVSLSIRTQTTWGKIAKKGRPCFQLPHYFIAPLPLY